MKIREFLSMGLKNHVMRCTVCGKEELEQDWDEVWSHREGEFVASCCIHCRAVGQSQYIPNHPKNVDGVYMSGLARLLKYVGQMAEPTFRKVSLGATNPLLQVPAGDAPIKSSAPPPNCAFEAAAPTTDHISESTDIIPPKPVAPAKPRRMKANPKSPAETYHSEEHDENACCQVFPMCQPVDGAGCEPAGGPGVTGPNGFLENE